MQFKDLVKAQPLSLTRAMVLDTIWLASEWLGARSRSSWNGYMEVVMENTQPYERSQVDALPFITTPLHSLLQVQKEMGQRE